MEGEQVGKILDMACDCVEKTPENAINILRKLVVNRIDELTDEQVSKILDMACDCVEKTPGDAISILRNFVKNKTDQLTDQQIGKISNVVCTCVENVSEHAIGILGEFVIKNKRNGMTFEDVIGLACRCIARTSQETTKNAIGILKDLVKDGPNEPENEQIEKVVNCLNTSYLEASTYIESNLKEMYNNVVIILGELIKDAKAMRIEKVFIEKVPNMIKEFISNKDVNTSNIVNLLDQCFSYLISNDEIYYDTILPLIKQVEYLSKYKERKMSDSEILRMTSLLEQLFDIEYTVRIENFGPNITLPGFEDITNILIMQMRVKDLISKLQVNKILNMACDCVEKTPGDAISILRKLVENGIYELTDEQVSKILDMACDCVEKTPGDAISILRNLVINKRNEMTFGDVNGLAACRCIARIFRKTTKNAIGILKDLVKDGPNEPENEQIEKVVSCLNIFYLEASTYIESNLKEMYNNVVIILGELIKDAKAMRIEKVFIEKVFIEKVPNMIGKFISNKDVNTPNIVNLLDQCFSYFISNDQLHYDAILSLIKQVEYLSKCKEREMSHSERLRMTSLLRQLRNTECVIYREDFIDIIRYNAFTGKVDNMKKRVGDLISELKEKKAECPLMSSNGDRNNTK